MNEDPAGSPHQAASGVTTGTGGGHVSASAHYWRLLIVLGLGVVCFLLLRTVLVPESFGRDGHYRATAVDDIVAREPLYNLTEGQPMGSGPCDECHGRKVEEVRGAAHKGVACELCHGPARDHLPLTGERAPMTVDRSRSLCLGCHARIAGRPDGFPQIDVIAHQTDNDFDAAMECVECHEGHDP